MTFPILIETHDGHFTASLAGVPSVRAQEPTRAAAIASLRAELEQRIEQGELLEVEVNVIGPSALAGKYRDDPTLREICEQAYQQRADEVQP